MTFPTAGILPKAEIQAKAFLERFPNADGRGIRVAILDSGVDLGAEGLQIRPDGGPKVVDAYDATGASDVDTSTIVPSLTETHEHGSRCIIGLTKRKLLIPDEWRNPSDEWHIGIKKLFDLFSDSLVKRMKEARKKEWDKMQNALMSSLRDQEIEAGPDKDKKIEADMKLLDQAATGFSELEDVGPIADVICWHNGEEYVVVVDAPTDEKGETDDVDLSQKKPMRRYGLKQDKALFSAESMAWYGVQIGTGGNSVQLVTQPSGHGTHVASIVGAYYPDNPELCGIAPGCEIVSITIGDCRMNNTETIAAMERALVLVKNLGCQIANMSFGEATKFPSEGRFVDVLRDLINNFNVIFVTSCGNQGPAISTVTAPATFADTFGIGAVVTPDLIKSTLGKVLTPPALTPFTWTSRGPTTDGHLGCTICAPGGAIATVPMWSLKKSQYMNGTSMASPNACGGLTLVLSKLRQEGRTIQAHQLKRGTMATAKEFPDVDPFAGGSGLLQVSDLYNLIDSGILQNEPRFVLSMGKKTGIYLREPDQVAHVMTEMVQCMVHFPHDSSSSSGALLDTHRSNDGDKDKEDKGSSFSKCSECDGSGLLKLGGPDKEQENACPHCQGGRASQKDTQRMHENLVAYEKRIVLRSSAPWVKPAESFFLVSGGRSFEVRVDPTHRSVLPNSINFAWVTGYDADEHTTSHMNGVQHSGVPLFQFPVTVIKPMPVPTEAQEIVLTPSQTERYFLNIPPFTSSLDISLEMLPASMRPDSARSIWLQVFYLEGGQHRDCYTVPQMKSGDSHTISVSFVDPVWGYPNSRARTVEFSIAHYSLSLEGLQTTLSCTFKTSTVNILPSPILLDGSLGHAYAETFVMEGRQRVEPRGVLSEIRRTYLPETGAKCVPLPLERAVTLTGERMYELVLRYTWDQPCAGKVSPSFPLLADRLYDSVLGALLWEVYDSCGYHLATGEAFPAKVELKNQKGYKIFLNLRCHSLKILQGFERLPMVIDSPLAQNIKLDLYTNLNTMTAGGKSTGGAGKTIYPGKAHQCFIKAPEVPSFASLGDILMGSFQIDAKDPIKMPLRSRATIGARGDKSISVPVMYFPTRLEKSSTSTASTNTSSAATTAAAATSTPIATTTPSVPKSDKDSTGTAAPLSGTPIAPGGTAGDADAEPSLTIQEMKRDADCAWLEKLPAAKKKEATEFLEKLEEEFPDHIPCKVLRLQINDTVEAADAILDSIDQNEVAAHFGHRASDTPEFAKTRKAFVEKRNALVEALKKKAAVAKEDKNDELFNQHMDAIASWVDVESLDDLFALRLHKAKINGHMGKALQIVEKMIKPSTTGNKKTAQANHKKEHYEERNKILEELKWKHIAFRESQLMLMLFPNSQN